MVVDRIFRLLRFPALLGVLLLGACVTGEGSSGGIRPVLSIERSSAPRHTEVAELGPGGSIRIPQMKVIPVPPRPTMVSLPRAGGRAVRAVARPTLPAGSGDLMMPLEDAVLTSTFGLREHPVLGGDRAHTGIDLAAPTGTPILAAAAGTVEAAGPNGGYGNYIRVRHHSGVGTAYGHLSRYASGIAAGAVVEQGQVIGYVGSTGMSTGPHLHWEVLVGDHPIDPFRIMAPETRVALARGITRSVAQLAAGGR